MPRRKRINRKKIILLAVCIFAVAVAICVALIVANNTGKIDPLAIFGDDLSRRNDEEDNGDDENQSSDELTKCAKELYQKVSEYDFSNGSNASLEREIKKLYKETESEGTIDARVSAIKAKVEYYLGLGKYHTAISTIDELKYYYENEDDELYALEKKIEAYKGIGNTEKANSLQSSYDIIKTGECGVKDDE